MSHDTGIIHEGIWYIKEKPVKVDKWETSAVKYVLDDAAKKVIIDKYATCESFRVVDGRLLICTIAVLFALFALVWDYLYPFPQSWIVLLTCSTSYFVMMGVLTLYTYFIESSVFLTADEKDPAGVDPDSVWRLYSSLKRFDDTYTLRMEYAPSSGAAHRHAEMVRSVGEFFDENGVLCYDRLQPELCKLADSLLTAKKTN